MATTKPVRFEYLENREVPALFGQEWLNADRLTMSFATDGVQAGSTTSSLYSELGQSMSTVEWQTEILKAFYRWTAEANINIGVVADNGQALGSAGFAATGQLPADLRIGAIDQSSEVVATSTPQNALAGLNAGQLLFNSNHDFNRGGTGGKFDLYTVALHEAANIFGLKDNDADSTSVRFGSYMGPRTGLNGGDVEAIRGMYGSRANDVFEGSSGNATTATARTLTAALEAGTTRYRIVADASITTSTDVDVYRFTTRSDTRSATIRLGTAGRSLLAGAVEVLDSSGRVLASRTNTSPLDGDTVLTVNGLRGNTSYFVRVRATQPDVFAVGTYQLRIGYGYDPVNEVRPDTIQRLTSDASDLRTSATTLTTTPGYAANTYYQASESISSDQDVDWFKVTAPSNATSDTVLTVSVYAKGGLSAAATVFCSSGQYIASETLIAGTDGTYRIQVDGIDKGKTYFICISNGVGGSTTSGSYVVQADFLREEGGLIEVKKDHFRGNSRDAIGIEVAEQRLYSFGLESDGATDVEMKIFDASGLVVATQRTYLGQPSTLTLQLGVGKYTVVFSDLGNSLDPNARYEFSAHRLSDPIDVYVPGTGGGEETECDLDLGLIINSDWESCPDYYNPWIGLNPSPIPTSPVASPIASTEPNLLAANDNSNKS